MSAGGSYSIDGGAFVTTAGTISPGQTVAVRQTSAAIRNMPACTTLTIGGVAGSFCVTTVAVTAPSAPTTVSAAAGIGSIKVNFGVPASNGGAAIAGYAATCTSSSGGVTSTNAGGASATSIQVGGLTNGRSYSCTVTASNSVGSGQASVSSNAVMPLDLTPILILLLDLD